MRSRGLNHIIILVTQISRPYVFNVPQISQIYTDLETYAVEGA